MLKTTILAATAAMLCSLPAHAGFISSVTKTGGNASCGADGCPSLDWEALSDTGLARNDRTHTLLEIPDELLEDNATQPSEIAEMIQLSNSDKGSSDVQHDITLSRLSILYIGIDNRQFDGPGGTTIQTNEYSWMSDTGRTGLPGPFINTHRVVGVDENNDGSANQYFTLFAAIAPAGTYSLFDHEGGGNNMYVVIADDHVLAPVPEPAGIALSIVGLLGLAALRRRNS